MDLRKQTLRNNSKEFEKRNLGYSNIYSQPLRQTSGSNERKPTDTWNSLRSPTKDEAYEIEQRHEELKRQIALKEK